MHRRISRPAYPLRKWVMSFCRASLGLAGLTPLAIAACGDDGRSEAIGRADEGIADSTAFVGCYTDKSARALPHELASSGATVEGCIALAKAQTLAYAGLQYGGQCFGGDTLGYVSVSDSECNMSCSAKPSEICGGSWRNSIYSTGTSSASSAHSVVLQWTASVTPNVTYDAYRSEGCTGTYAMQASGIEATTWMDSSVTSGKTYCYVTTAVNADGQSVDSKAAEAVVP